MWNQIFHANFACQCRNTALLYKYMHISPLQYANVLNDKIFTYYVMGYGFLIRGFF